MATMTVWVRQPGDCWHCGGTGRVPSGFATCGICHGQGEGNHVAFQVQMPRVFVWRIHSLDEQTVVDWIARSNLWRKGESWPECK